MSETFYRCESCGALHHYKAAMCQACGKPLRQVIVDDAKSLRKALGIPEPKASKK